MLASLPNESFAGPNAGAPVPRYDWAIAGFHQGADSGLVTGWNNHGNATFIRVHSPPVRSYWWDGQMEVELPSGISDYRVTASDINDNGRIAGQVFNFANHRAAIWDNGNVHVLGTLGGRQSTAYAVNSSGTVAGRSQIANGDYHVFTWDGAFHDLGPLPTGNGDLKAMNDADEIIGYSLALINGWVWSNGQFTNLPDLRGGRFGSPEDISNTGLIVGASYINQQTKQPVTWRDGQVAALPKPAGSNGGVALAVNSKEFIVGSVYFGESPLQASLWVNNQVYLLRDLANNVGSWNLREAELINDRGQIVVLAQSDQFGWERIILTPVPEPQAFASSIVCVVATIIVMRHRRLL